MIQADVPYKLNELSRRDVTTAMSLVIGRYTTRLLSSFKSMHRYDSTRPPP